MFLIFESGILILKSSSLTEGTFSDIFISATFKSGILILMLVSGITGLFSGIPVTEAKGTFAFFVKGAEYSFLSIFSEGTSKEI